MGQAKLPIPSLVEFSLQSFQHLLGGKMSDNFPAQLNANNIGRRAKSVKVIM